MAMNFIEEQAKEIESEITSAIDEVFIKNKEIYTKELVDELEEAIVNIINKHLERLNHE